MANIQHRFISEDDFDEQFTITANAHNDRYETYGQEHEELLEILKNEPARVWTACDTDDGNITYLSGYHRVNRQYYIITDEAVDTNISFEVVLDD